MSINIKDLAKGNIFDEKIEGVMQIFPEKREDCRGFNFEGYNKEEYVRYTPFKHLDFIVDSFSCSSKNVLRGFHGDSKTWKLIQCLSGEIQFALIDVRPESPTFFNSLSWYLKGSVPTQILVPPGVVNAHLCLSDTCVFSYKLSHKYVPIAEQLHVKWNDEVFTKRRQWDIKHPILSKRDSE